MQQGFQALRRREAEFVREQLAVRDQLVGRLGLVALGQCGGLDQIQSGG